MCEDTNIPGGKVFSSKFYPEMCARNSHGQFVRRKVDSNGNSEAIHSSLG